ncbi:hypothetical protein S83_039430 [Arachis hypogaea]
MKPLIRITGPLRCCLSLLQSRRRRRRRLDDPSPFPIVMILPFSSSKSEERNLNFYKKKREKTIKLPLLWIDLQSKCCCWVGRDYN